MNNLVFSCSDALPQPSTPVCLTDYGERIVMLAFMKEGGTIAVVSTDYPTYAEFQEAVTTGEITIIKGVTNGQRVKQTSTVLSGNDTITGGEEEYNKTYRVQGRIRLINESIKSALKKMDYFSQLRAWFFTEKNYVWGGQTGYKCVASFDDVTIEGLGNPPYIAFHFDYVSTGYDQAGYDASFSALENS